MITGDFIDITDLPYGAHPNNTDNKAQIQQALDQGKKIYVPKGVFNVSGSLLTRSKTTLFGEGTLKLSSPTDIPVIKIVDVNHVALNGLTLDSNFAQKSRGTYATIFVAKSSNIYVHEVYIKNTSNFGVEVEDSKDITIEGCNITNFLQRGINLVFCHGTTLLGNYIDGILPNGKLGIHGIEIWGKDGDDIKSTSHVAVSNTVKNVNGGGIWTSWVDDITIMGNDVENCQDVCIDVEGTQYATIAGNRVKNGKNGGISTFYASQHVLINGNDVVQEKGHGAGIRIFGKGISSEIQISRNTIQTDDSIGISTNQGVLSNSKIYLNHIRTKNNIGIRMLEANKISLLKNIVLANGKNKGITIEGGSECLIEANKVMTHTDQARISADQYPDAGGIYLYWRNEEFNCQRNKVLDNIIKGFQISINDNCWGNSNSKNVIEDNLVENISYNKQAGKYGGSIKNNRSFYNSSQKAKVIVY